MGRHEVRDQNGNLIEAIDFVDPPPFVASDLAAAYQDVVNEVTQISDPHTKLAFAKLKTLLRLAFKRLGMED